MKRFPLALAAVTSLLLSGSAIAGDYHKDGTLLCSQCHVMHFSQSHGYNPSGSGFVFTPLTANGRTEKPAAAWTPEQTVDFMLESLERGDFYILCPDNDVPRALDERRILWAAGDIVENRPPLSRWHPDWAEAFKAFAAGK